MKAGGVSGKFSIRYITHTQSVHEGNTGLQASLSLIEPIQAANTAELIFFHFTEEPRLGKESTFCAQTPAADPSPTAAQGLGHHRAHSHPCSTGLSWTQLSTMLPGLLHTISKY